MKDRRIFVPCEWCSGEGNCAWEESSQASNLKDGTALPNILTTYKFQCKKYLDEQGRCRQVLVVIIEESEISESLN